MNSVNVQLKLGDILRWNPVSGTFYSIHGIRIKGSPGRVFPTKEDIFKIYSIEKHGVYVIGLHCSNLNLRGYGFELSSLNGANIPDTYFPFSLCLDSPTKQEEPKNNDGRSECFWCQSKTKKVQSIFSVYSICTKCGR